VCWSLIGHLLCACVVCTNTYMYIPIYIYVHMVIRLPSRTPDLLRSKRDLERAHDYNLVCT
jgi:hypothetical protein